jgi:intein/homing endonuclease
MYGDGCIYKRFSKETNNHTGTFFSLACALNRPDIIEKLKNNWLKVFKCEIKEYSTKGNWLNLNFSSQKLYQFLLKNEIAKEKAGNLKFPNKILNSPIDIQLSFIGGYFDADGYASDKKKGFVFTSIDLFFLKTIKYILASIGILTKIHIEDRSSKNWQTLYTLVIVGATSKIKFKKSLVESLKMVKTEIHSNRDCFVTIYRSSELLIDNYNNYSYMPDNTQYVSLNCIRKLKENNVKIKIENPVLYQDFIKEIIHIGESEIVELDIDSDFGVFINGFLV